MCRDAQVPREAMDDLSKSEEVLNETRRVLQRGRSGDMFGHQDIGINTTIEFSRAFLHLIKISPIVLLGIEIGLAIISALDNVHGWTNTVGARRR